jgi:ketosteroid isomerase-like protein
MVPSISVRGVLVALALANGCGPPRPVESDDAMSQVRGVIARYDSAWLAKDSVAVASWLATDYVYFTSSGGRSDRASTLRFLSDTGYSLRGQQRTELDISIVGQVARTASRWRGQGRYGSELVDDDQTCVQHWRDAVGRWEMFSEQCVNRARSSP